MKQKVNTLTEQEWEYFFSPCSPFGQELVIAISKSVLKLAFAGMVCTLSLATKIDTAQGKQQPLGTTVLKTATGLFLCLKQFLNPLVCKYDYLHSCTKRDGSY